MTAPDWRDVADSSRPRPVRIAAFVGLLLLALLGVAAIVFRLAPALIGAITVVIGVIQLGGWLFVERAVTPTSNPAARIDGNLIKLVPAQTTEYEVPGSRTGVSQAYRETYHRKHGGWIAGGDGTLPKVTPDTGGGVGSPSRLGEHPVTDPHPSGLIVPETLGGPEDVGPPGHA